MRRRNKTLLMDFIMEKIKGIPSADPEREGKRKGDPIGPSRKKALATIFLLRKMPYSEIAELSGAKVSSVAIWHGRDDVKEVMDRYAAEFVEKIKPDVLAAVKKAWSGQAPTGNDLPEFSDRHLYSAAIIKALFEWATGHPDIKVSQGVLLMFGSNKAVTEYLAEVLLRKIQRCQTILQGQKLNLTERNDIAGTLLLAQEYLQFTKEERK